MLSWKFGSIKLYFNKSLFIKFKIFATIFLAGTINQPMKFSAKYYKCICAWLNTILNRWKKQNKILLSILTKFNANKSNNIIHECICVTLIPDTT